MTAIPDDDAMLPGVVQVFTNLGNDTGGVWQGLAANDPITIGRDPTAVAVGFFDADASLDVAVTNRTDNTITILLNPFGNGLLVVAGTVAVGNDPSGIVTADFNEDGFTDLAVTLETDQSFEVFFGDGTGNFTPGPGPELPGIGFTPSALFTGDFDGNKCPDLIGPGSTSGAINGGTSAGKVFVALGLGNGTFAAPVVYDVGLNPRGISACDINQDGSLDIITANFDDNTLSVLLNLGDGTFDTAVAIPVGLQPRAVECVDLSADGVPDLAVVAEDTEIGPAVQILQNTIAEAAGGVSFDPPVPFTVDADPNFVVAADLNQDGAFDLVTVNQNSDSVSVLLGEPAAISFPASLDIKPGTCPNTFNRSSNGKFPLALVGRKDFDVSLVDISTLRLSRAAGIGGELAPFDGPPGPHTVIEDAATPFTGELCDCDILAGDGVLDLSMKFSRPAMTSVLALEGLAPGANVELVLSGTLLDGTPFEARDCIQIVPDGAPGLVAVRSNGPTVFVQVSPPDTNFNAGGYVNFDRTYVDATTVTLTAPALHQGWIFIGWSFSGSGRAVFQEYGPLLGDQSIEVYVGPGLQEVHAVYINIITPVTPAAQGINAMQ